MNQALERPRGRRKLRTATVLAGLGGLAAAGLAGAGPALADSTNGEQVYFYDLGSSHVQICGYNQNGTHVCTPWFSAVPGDSIYIHNYWWKGRVWIYGYNESAQNSACIVPAKYYSDWYQCGML
jgi:hypothetical protein